MNSQTEEKHHHHHHQSGSHRHKKRSSKPKQSDQIQQQDDLISRNSQPKTAFESISTLDKDTFSNNTSLQNQDDLKQENKVFSLAEMESIAKNDTFYVRIKDEIKKSKRKFINSIQSIIPEYVKIVEEKLNLHSNYNGKSGRFLYNDDYDNNFNNLLSDDDAKRFSKDSENNLNDNNSINYFNNNSMNDINNNRSCDLI